MENIAYSYGDSSGLRKVSVTGFPFHLMSSYLAFKQQNLERTLNNANVLFLSHQLYC